VPRIHFALALLLCLSALVWSQEPTANYPFTFRDVGVQSGLLPVVAGIRGHGAAWGDVDGDGWPDLFVAPFHDAGSKSGQFFRNDQGKFRLDKQEHLRTTGMGSGALFVDLANSGRLDLYISTCATEGKDAARRAPSYLFRNDGQGRFTDISKNSGATLPAFAGRGLAAADFDGDGLLDLILCERYYGQVKHGPVLLRNLGGHRFANVSADVGLPPRLSGLGVAVADFNRDGWPDLFFTEGGGEHRLYLNNGKGAFAEAAGTRDVFRWKNLGKDDTPAGVCVADVNRDGLPDVLIGHHFKNSWREPAPVRLYLHRGVKDAAPIFEEITAPAGLVPLAMKAPHVEIQDFDNDGWPDLYASIVVFANNKPCPVIYKHLGVQDGLPRFREDAMALTDFPTPEDKALKRVGPLFDKALKEKKIIYMAAAPSADFDRDGKLDLFLANWWIDAPSLLLRNETRGGHWLDVQVEGKNGMNRMGIGARIDVYPAGDSTALIGSREIAIGYGFCSGQEAVAHFGLGTHEVVDLKIVLPHGRGTLTEKNVKADQRVVVK
jgi:hypothetical protein